MLEIQASNSVTGKRRRSIRLALQGPATEHANTPPVSKRRKKEIRPSASSDTPPGVSNIDATNSKRAKRTERRESVNVSTPNAVQVTVRH
jgi:hypothetical protein